MLPHITQDEKKTLTPKEKKQTTKQRLEIRAMTSQQQHCQLEAVRQSLPTSDRMAVARQPIQPAKLYNLLSTERCLQMFK